MKSRLKKFAEQVTLLDREPFRSEQKIEECIELYPEVVNLEDEFGDLINYYKKDNIAQFAKENVDFPDDKNLKWMSLWDNVIKNSVNNYFKKKDYRTSDIDFLPDEALVVIYDKDEKLYFNLRIVGIKITNYDLINKDVKEIRFNPSALKIEFAGSKDY